MQPKKQIIRNHPRPLGRGRRVLLSILAVLLLASSSRSAPPEVIRVHVPTSGVATWFPAGTPLRIVTPEQLDALLDAATRASARVDEVVHPRLIRARHHARLKAGVLVGSSRLTVMASASGQGIFPLDPWTPAILPSTRRQVIAGALQSGRTALWIEPTPDAIGAQRELTIDWELSARPDSDGRSFALGLPGDESSELSLELPAGSVPVGLSGYRQGPFPTTASDLVTWRFHGRPGQGNLQLLDSSAGHSPSGESLLWVSGPTQITLGLIAGSDPETASWETDWRVVPDRLGRLQFSAELDPGLELIDVTGPDVREYESHRQSETTTVRVILTVNAGRDTLVRFRAHARIPLEGHWNIPAIRPLDAIWTGGTTTVIVDSIRAIEDCRQRAGRRVPAQGGDFVASNSLVFEATAPASVAELVFRQPRDQTACRVRGRLSVGRSGPTLECQLDGISEVASATELDVDLPPTWVPDRVSWAGTDESLAWHWTVLADGSARLRALIPKREKPQESRPLVIGATSTVRDGRGPLDLPRIRPAGVPVADEVWVAMVDRTMNLTPTEARGLVWIDPNRVEGPMGPAPLRTFDPRPALAWRWNADAGFARVQRELIEQAPRAEIHYRAHVEEDGLHLVLEGQISLFRGTRPLSQLPVWESESKSGQGAWSFRWKGQDQEIPRSALDERQRSLYGFPETGQAWNLDLAGPPADQTRIQLRARLPWAGKGTIPLLFLSKQHLPRSTVLIEVPRHIQARARAVDLQRLETTMAEQLAASWEQERATSLAARSKTRRSTLVIDGFTYTEAAGTLELFTEELKQKASGGLIRDAYLTTLLYPQGHWPSRLRLMVHAEEPRELVFSLPPVASLVRVERDGIGIVPLREGDRIKVALTPSTSGDRYQTIDLNFEIAGQPLRSGTLLQPVMPHFDMPCLSFCWEVSPPPGWQASANGPGLLPADLKATPVWPCGALGIPDLRWTVRGPTARVPSPETLQQLDDGLSASSSEELTFAEWFARWDSPTHPLLIDRFALSSSGYGPRSRCVPVRMDPKRQSPSLLTLKQYALTLVPLDSGLLITSGAEASRFEGPESLLPAVAETVLWGCDRSDRFQTTQRWRGETTPKGAAAGKAAGPLRALPGWSVWRFTSASWPDPAMRIELRDGRTGLSVSRAAALFVLLCCSVLRLPARWQILVPTAVAGLALLIHLWLRDRLSAPTAGLFVGALGCLFYRLGFQLTRCVTGEPALRPRAIRRFLARFPLRAMPVLLGAIFVGRASALARRAGEDPPIQVLIPYEGTYQPGQPADRIVVRQSDYQLLEKLAELRPAAPDPEVVLVGASHHLSWSGQREVLLESELELRASGEATWKLPVGGAREISAVLDGRAVPVFIEAGGQQAVIAVPAAGSFKLLARRILDVTGDEPAVTLDFRVNPHPEARLVVDRPGRFGALKLCTARGRRETANDRLIAGLGPADHALLRWGDNDAATQTAGVVMDGTLLWDIMPAGDLLQARFTCRTTARRISSLSFQLEKGLIPRSVQVPGLIASAILGTDKQPVWTMRFDPPLQDKSELRIEMWRPVESEPDSRDGVLTRRLPRLEPLGVEKYSGLLGARRPGHWSGRLQPIEGTDPLNDQSFVKIWGSLPDDGLILAGTTRLAHDVTPFFQTGPAVARVKIRPTLELHVEPGRINVALDAAFDGYAGTLDHLKVAIPPELVILSVKSEGLTHWSRTDARRLLLRYDRAFPRLRNLSIHGWIPVPQDPMTLSSQSLSMPTPWIELLGVENLPGKLVIDSEVPLDIKDATGLFALPSPKASSPAPLPMAAEARRESRFVYRIDDSSRLGHLSWISPSPTVNVAIESQMQIHRDAAQWVAVLRYDVLGGARQNIHLKLPAAWAFNAQLDLAGTAFHHRTASVGPSMFWTITPDHPVWGTQRLVIRSALANPADQEVAYPEIAPLGQGHIDTYLGLVYTDRQALSIAGTNGLHEISPGSHFSDFEFSHEPGTQARAFHVDSDRWWLKVQASAASAHSAASSDESARALSADLNLVLLPDHTLLGQAVYETEVQSGRFLVIELPEESSVIGLTVDQNPVLPLESKSGRWLVPLAESGTGHVNLFWKKPAHSATEAEQPWSCTLPKAGVGRCSTLLTLYLPPNMTAQSAFAGLEQSSPDRVELERADRLAQQLTDFVARIDRSSGRDRQRALGLLISHEMALRDVERSLRWNARRGDRARRGQADRGLEILEAARRTLRENLGAAALDDEIDAAGAYFGAASKAAPTSPVAMPDPPSPDRLRNLGRPSFLIGMSSGLDEPPSRILGVLSDESGAETQDVTDAPDQGHARAIFLLGFLVAILVTVGVRIPRLATTLVICAGLLGLLTFLDAPVLAAAGFVLFAVGCAARSRDANTAAGNVPLLRQPAS
jgi:hypothetical protein